MIYGLSFKGTHISEFENLFMKSKNRSLLPVLRKKQADLSGVHGTYDYGNNTYDNCVIEVEFTVDEKKLPELRLKARQLAAWLSGEGRLIFDDEPDKFYWAKVYSAIPIGNNLTEIFSVQFECRPFASMVISTGIDPTWEEADFPWDIDMPWTMSEAYTFSATEASEFTFEHPGTQAINYRSPQGSMFNIIVTGSFADLTITLNGKTLQYIEPAEGILTINNVDMEVDLDGINKLDVIEGDIDTFFSVEPGDNALNITGTDLVVEVLIDFIPLWL